MLELSEKNVTDYLRGRGNASDQPLLVQSLSGGVANVVLKVFDPGAGAKVGTDTRSPAQIKRHVPDPRMNQGACFVLKQPLPKFKTAAEWLVDIDRVHVERDCMKLLGQILPAGSVPDVLWFDEANYVLAISCAPTESLIWKQHLLHGRFSAEAAQLAGMLLGMMHTATRGDPAVAGRYGEEKFFIQQRTDPYLASLKPRHADVAPIIDRLIHRLLTHRVCLVHGDYSPKNIFLVPKPTADATPPAALAQFPLSHLLLLDFEVAFYGDPAYDVATLVNHLLLKCFHLKKPWRAGMIAIDAFWQSYLHTADKALAADVAAHAGTLLGALLLARVDGKSPAEYLTDEATRQRVRETGRAIMQLKSSALDAAIDHAADVLAAPG
jgi:5-methylthioribose kinase